MYRQGQSLVLITIILLLAGCAGTAPRTAMSDDNGPQLYGSIQMGGSYHSK